ncbi:MAG: 2Fe-2S iron-sulfur cluster-binding protein [Pirellulaceae bacterium]
MSQVIILFAASALVIVATSQFASAGISATRIRSRAHRRYLHTLKNLRNAAEIARLDSELQAATSNQSNLDWRVMEVAEIVDESDDCRSFYLVDPYRQQLPDFRPGQYLMVRPALAGAFQTTRCYSLSSSPDGRYWRITVKRQEPPTAEMGLPPTKMGLSVWLHENILAGDCLLVGGPNGHFYLPAESTQPLVLLAAGVGITPMASMLRWSMENTPERPVVLLYQAKDQRHWPLGESLHSWLPEFPACKAISYFSRASGDDLRKLAVLPGEFHEGKFTAMDVLAALTQDDCNYYFCGPDAWMQQLRDGLTDAGVSSQRMHWESFGSAGVPKPHAAESETGFQVSFRASGTDAVWTDPEQSLWELARQNDVELPSGCLSGVCGSCRARLLGGSVAYDRNISVELKDDECLTCVAHPTSDVQLDI